MGDRWKVGDGCRAPFSGDGDEYSAVIRRIWEEDGDRVAEVWFKGYSSDENEVVKLADLKAISDNDRPSQSRQWDREHFKSPLLDYISETERIRVQYADMYNDPVPRTRPTESPGLKRPNAVRSKETPKVRKRKGMVAMGGAVKTSTQRKEGKHELGRTSQSSPSNPIPTVSARREVDQAKDFPGFEEGFSCEDVEKPSFPSKSDVSPKEPLVLSVPGEHPVIQVPGTMNRYLRDYQREGIQFLYGHYSNGKGAILGDDMGLGKTVQVIGLICALLGKTGGKQDFERKLPQFLQQESPEKEQTKVFLIICPNSVLYNWLDEFETWTHCIVARYHGKERDETLRRAQRRRLDAVVTTYETYRLYLDDLLTVSWDAVFVDEVHKIKEPGALITKALKEINTLKRFGLSGTALQNKMAELWCVLDWANPGCLGGWKDFREEYDKVINAGQKYNANKRELADARQVAKRFALVRSKWLIRRTKALIAHQLPTKDENVVFCNLSSLQLAVYRALLESADMDLVLRQKEPCDCGKDAKRGQCCYTRNERGEKIKSLTFGLMSLMIKVSNHIALLIPDGSMSKKQRVKSKYYCEVAFAKHPQFVELSREARFATLSDPSYCGKMQVLEKLLTVFKKENNKVLLFSCYTRLLDILEMYLKTTYYTYRRLDGKTPAQDRQKYVHEFNRDPDIFLFLISTKAGGIGLNLTGANVVVIFDPNWNPTHDLQAQDRAYRIGQHRDVRVYRLISRGSIEENMYLRQLYKQQLASVAMTTANAKRYFTAVAGDKEQQGEIFGLHNLFALRVDGSLTKDVIQREERTEQGITMAKYNPPAPDNMEDPSDELVDQEDRADEPQDEDDDDADIHGLASQIEEISSENDDDGDDDKDVDDGENCSDHQGGRVSRYDRRDSTRPKTSISHPISESDSDDAELSDYNGETDESGAEDELARMRLVRGKALMGRDGQVISKVKGHQSRGGKSLEVRVHQQQEGSNGVTTVEDVFKKCGVTYIHSNQRVIGGSHIEDHVSEVAQKDVFEMGQFSQEPAYCQVPTLAVESLDSDSDDKSIAKKKGHPAMKRSQSQAASFRLGDTTLLVGQTPLAIKRDQFKEMASVLKFGSPSALSRHIQTLSDEGCRPLLLGFNMEKYGIDCAEYIKLPNQPRQAAKSMQNTKAVETRKPRQRGRTETTRTKVKQGVTRRKGGNTRTRTKVARKHKATGMQYTSGDNSDDDDADIARIAESVSDSDDDIEGAFMSRGRRSRRDTGREIEQNKVDRVTNKNKAGKPGTVDCKVQSNSTNPLTQPSRDRHSRPKENTEAVKAQTDINTSASNTQQSRLKSENRCLLPNESSDSMKEGTDNDTCASHSQRVPLKREHNLSFLDEIFLGSDTTTKRKPPPRKAIDRHDRTILAARSGIDYASTADSIISDGLTPDLSSHERSKVKMMSDKKTNCSRNSASSTLTSAKTDMLHHLDPDNQDDDDNDASLWKRNAAFVPHQTCFTESDESDDSQSLFVVNTKFKGSCMKKSNDISENLSDF